MYTNYVIYDADQVVRIARALSHQIRLHILQSLLRGEATVTDLVEQLHVDQPRVSAHLAILSRAGLVFAQRTGRQKTYSVDKHRIEILLTSLSPTASNIKAMPSAGALRERQSNTPLRQARTCYDHLAGVAGVRFLDEILRQEWLVPDDANPESYLLTLKGERALQDRAVDLPSARNARRALARGCPDWTERRPHLAGSLGAAILHSLEEAGAIDRQPTSRAVKLRPAIFDWLHNS